ncbi:hypothetical protein H0274_01765 [Altererythrobacter sp. CC-YST694]|uniref:hypothetical protein n=1 Tax=Altererythrobacter sp. CC-YST694 TaxID=2755038 RepID=UPI001D01F571|nr:hypothetical protein [Altererythrobacter sp. CC-YST694]MCB5423972.1 hypothetical protein [Altererythrobacter sp. CC-YST694]
MSKSIDVNTKTQKRRPDQTGTLVGTRFQPEMLARIDEWIVRVPPPYPSRPEAVRRLIGPMLDYYRQLDVGLDPQIVGLDASEKHSIEQWRKSLPDELSLPEAIRHLIKEGLKHERGK